MAPRKIDTQIVEIDGDESGYRAALRRAKSARKRFADDNKASLGALGSVFQGIGAAAALGATGAAVAFAKTSEEVDRLAKTASRLGIATEQVSGMQLAAEETGVSTRQLGLGLQRATRRISEAAQGSGVAAGALKELGLSAKDLNKLSPDEQFRELADAFSDVGQRSNQVRLAFKLFDSEGVGLLNTLDLGKEGLLAFQQQAEKLGIALTRFDTSRIERSNDALLEANRALTGLARQATAAFAPLTEVLADLFVDSLGDIRDWRDTFETAVSGAGKVIGAFGRAWFAVDAAVASAFGTTIQAVAVTVGTVTDALSDLRQAAGRFGDVIIEQEGLNSLRDFSKESALLAATFLEDAKKSEAAGEAFAKSFASRLNAARSLRSTPENNRPANDEPTISEADKKAAAKRREQQRQQLEQLERFFASRRELLQRDFEDRQKQIKTFADAELVNDAQARALTNQNAARLAQELTKIEEEESQKRIDAAKRERDARAVATREQWDLITQTAQQGSSLLNSIGSTIVSAAGANNKGALEAQKAWAVAAIAVNTAVGASRAIAELGLAGIPAAAAITAGGVASVARVAATDIGNSAALGGQTGGSPAAQGLGVEGTVCEAVREVQSCGGGKEDDAESDGRLGSGPTFLVVGDGTVDDLIDKIRERMNNGDQILFGQDSKQAKEAFRRAG